MNPDSLKGLVVYLPIAGEADYAQCKFFAEKIAAKNLPAKLAITLPQFSRSDPFDWAKICIKKFKKSQIKDNEIAILVPGTAFDMQGNRKGRGAGWYDRFLSAIPRSWIRIGVAWPEQIQGTLVGQNIWDEKMDYLLIQGQAEIITFILA